jgi:hypothetical protein
LHLTVMRIVKGEHQFSCFHQIFPRLLLVCEAVKLKLLRRRIRLCGDAT